MGKVKFVIGLSDILFFVPFLGSSFYWVLSVSVLR